MAERWILNASPIIVLARVGQTKLFSQLADTVAVPEAVIDEVLVGPPEDAARQLWQRERPFPVVTSPSPPPDLVAWDLGAGETAVLSYALANPGWIAVLDDGQARKCARGLVIPHKGTLAIIVAAKQAGLVPSASTVLRELQNNGFHLQDELVRQVLAHTTGEEW